MDWSMFQILVFKNTGWLKNANGLQAVADMRILLTDFGFNRFNRLFHLLGQFIEGRLLQACLFIPYCLLLNFGESIQTASLSDLFLFLQVLNFLIEFDYFLS
jgi:hypothetical protein